MRNEAIAVREGRGVLSLRRSSFRTIASRPADSRCPASVIASSTRCWAPGREGEGAGKLCLRKEASLPHDHKRISMCMVGAFLRGGYVTVPRCCKVSPLLLYLIESLSLPFSVYLSSSVYLLLPIRSLLHCLLVTAFRSAPRAHPRLFL